MPVVTLSTPLDLTGAAPTNLFTNELVQFNTSLERFFVPSKGPFYTTTLEIRHGVTNALLQPETQFKILHPVKEAIRMSGKEVCTAIYITDTSIPSVRLTYRVIGGIFADTASEIGDIIANNPLPPSSEVSWWDILDKPDQFTPSEHLHHVDNIYGMSDVVAVLENIRIAILAGDSVAIGAIYQYINVLLSNLNFATENYVDDTFTQLGSTPYVRTFKTYNDLRAFSDLVNNESYIYLATGKNAVNDRLGNIFMWDVSSTETDDDRFVLKPDHVLVANPGRYVSPLRDTHEQKKLATSVQRVLNTTTEEYEDSLLLNNAFVTVDCNNYVKEGKYWVADMANIANAPFSNCVMEVTNIAALNADPSQGEVLQVFDDGLGKRARRIRQYVSPGVYQWSDLIIKDDTVLPPSGTGPFVPIEGSSIDLDDYTTTGNFSFSTAVFPANAPPAPPGPATTFQLQVLVTPTFRDTVQIAINTTSNKTYVRGGYENEHNFVEFYNHYWRQVPTIDSVVNDTSVNNILTDGSYLCRIENSSAAFFSWIPLICCRAFLLYVKNAPSTQTIVQVVYNLIDDFDGVGDAPGNEVYKICVRAADFNQGPLYGYNAEFNNRNSISSEAHPLGYFLSYVDMNKLQNYLGPDGLVVSGSGTSDLSNSLYSAYTNEYGIGLGRILVDTDLNLVKNEGFYIFRSEDNVINTPPALNSSERFYVMLTIGTTNTAQVIFQPYGKHSTSSVYVRHQSTNDWNNGVTPPDWVLLPN